MKIESRSVKLNKNMNYLSRSFRHKILKRPYRVYLIIPPKYLLSANSRRWTKEMDIKFLFQLCVYTYLGYSVGVSIHLRVWVSPLPDYQMALSQSLPHQQFISVICYHYYYHRTHLLPFEYFTLVAFTHSIFVYVAFSSVLSLVFINHLLLFYYRNDLYIQSCHIYLPKLGANCYCA